AKDGKEPEALVGPDVEKWFHRDRFQGKPGLVAQWAKRHAGLAEAWVKATGDAVKEQWGKKTTTAEGFIAQWRQDFPDLYARWQKDYPGADASSTADLAAGFFTTFSAAHPGWWPYLADQEARGEKRKKLHRVKAAKEVADDQNEIQAVFFDLWRQEHP